MSVAISSKDEFIVSGSADETVRVWSFTSGETTRVLEGHDGKVFSVKISSDDSYLVSGGEDGSVRTWDLTGEEETQVMMQRE